MLSSRYDQHWYQTPLICQGAEYSPCAFLRTSFCSHFTQTPLSWRVVTFFKKFACSPMRQRYSGRTQVVAWLKIKMRWVCTTRACYKEYDCIYDASDYISRAMYVCGSLWCYIMLCERVLAWILAMPVVWSCLIFSDKLCIWFMISEIWHDWCHCVVLINNMKSDQNFWLNVR